LKPIREEAQQARLLDPALPEPEHRAQVKDGVLCRGAADPDRFRLIGERGDVEEHWRIRELMALSTEEDQTIVDDLSREERGRHCSDRQG
jgi:hypothetical protein